MGYDKMKRIQPFLTIKRKELGRRLRAEKKTKSKEEKNKAGYTAKSHEKSCSLLFAKLYLTDVWTNSDRAFH